MDDAPYYHRLFHYSLLSPFSNTLWSNLSFSPFSLSSTSYSLHTSLLSLFFPIRLKFESLAKTEENQQESQVSKTELTFQKEFNLPSTEKLIGRKLIVQLLRLHSFLLLPLSFHYYCQSLMEGRILRSSIYRLLYPAFSFYLFIQLSNRIKKNSPFSINISI